ncbi:MAG: helix-turn-helix domain-containing protein [Thermoplasmata archaeon]|nr:helix-turn-helix domain-containing protein [Thermoplasmata archaeon]
MLTEARFHGVQHPEWGRLVRGYPGVYHVQILPEGEATGIYRVTATVPEYLPLLQKLRIVTRYPFWVEKGVGNWVMTGSKPQIRELVLGLRRLLPEVVVVEIRPGLPVHAGSGLTASEREAVRSALAAGYFEVPRGISLTNLARRLQVSKGNLSKRLAAAEGKMMSSNQHALLQVDD